MQIEMVYMWGHNAISSLMGGLPKAWKTYRWVNAPLL